MRNFGGIAKQESFLEKGCYDGKFLDHVLIPSVIRSSEKEAIY